jgi:probable HAF family extracellular repeat protein
LSLVGALGLLSACSDPTPAPLPHSTTGSPLRTLALAAGGISDLGTLGGTTSNAYGVNDVGQVVGSSTTAEGSIHAFIWDQSTRIMRDLGTLGGNFSEARSIDNSGHIIGWSSIAGDEGTVRPVTWDVSSGAIHEVFAALPGYRRDMAIGMSSAGFIAGRMDGDGLWTRGFVFDPSTSTTRDLGSLNDGFSAVESINGAGAMVGFSSTGCCFVPVVWSGPAAGMQPLALDPQGGGYGTAESINDNGAIVGQADPGPAGNPTAHAILWLSSSAPPIDLGTGSSDFDYSAGWSINNSNVIAGFLFNRTTGLERAAAWDPVTYAVTELGALAPTASSAVTHVNNGTGTGLLAVGWSQTAASSEHHAVIWSFAPRFAFAGFFSPVDNPPTVNVTKAGSAVPVKFSLGGDFGLAVFASGYPVSGAVACDSGAPTSEIEQTVTANGSSLSYDTITQTYTYVWKTDKAWAGTCRQLVVGFADGSQHQASFQFK